MRALFAGLQPQHRPGTYDVHIDARGANHVIIAGERGDHTLSATCICNPTVRHVVDDNTGAFYCWTLIHRRIRNSRSLYQPWELGH